MNEDRDGIVRLREAIDTVAQELEGRAAGVARPRKPVRWIAGAAAVIALAAWLTLFGPTRDPEVEVRVLKVRGQAVRARLVRSETPSTILVVPEPASTRTPVVSTAIPGGMP